MARYALALSVGVVFQTLSLDWLRLAATRFYSVQEQRSRPEIRATLDVLYASIASLAIAAAIGIALFGFDLPLSPGLAALAIGTAVFQWPVRFFDGAAARPFFSIAPMVRSSSRRIFCRLC